MAGLHPESVRIHSMKDATLRVAAVAYVRAEPWEPGLVHQLSEALFTVVKLVISQKAVVNS